MSEPYVATLTESGYINDPYQKLDRLISYFLESNASQSFLFPRKTASLAYLVAKNSGRIEDLPGEVISTLNSYLRTSFVTVSVKSSVTKDNSSDPTKASYILHIAAECVTSEGKTVSLKKVKDLNTLLSTVLFEADYGDSF